MLDIVTTMNLLRSFCMCKRFTKNLNLYSPFLWIGFNCLKATEPLRGGSLQICVFYNFISPLTAYSKKVRHKMTNFEKNKNSFRRLIFSLSVPLQHQIDIFKEYRA